MKTSYKIIAIFGTLVLAVIVLVVVFNSRRPVLILADHSFMRLYGVERTRNEANRASRALFRPIKVVIIADGVGDDIIQIAITDTSSNPFCVLFPFRFLSSAIIYHEHNPDVRVVILEGRDSQDSERLANLSGYFIYKTDISADFYRAGIAASELSLDYHGKIAIFLEPGIEVQAREAFLRALNDQGKLMETYFFTSFSEFPEIPGLSIAVLAGVGLEFLNENPGVPAILFSWFEPFLIPSDVVLVINDSPLAQAVQAVSMVSAGTENGSIRSNFIALDKARISGRLLRKIQKSQ